MLPIYMKVRASLIRAERELRLEGPKTPEAEVLQKKIQEAINEAHRLIESNNEKLVI